MDDVETLPDYMGEAKRHMEERLPVGDGRWDRAFLETDCPKCVRHVNAHIIDGPDPVFVELACPRIGLCDHVWSERVL